MDRRRTIRILREKLSELERMEYDNNSSMNNHMTESPLSSSSTPEHGTLNGGPSFRRYQHSAATTPTERQPTIRIKSVIAEDKRNHSLQEVSGTKNHGTRQMESTKSVRTSSLSIPNMNGILEEPQREDSNLSEPYAMRRGQTRTTEKNREKLIKVDPRKLYEVDATFSGVRTTGLDTDLNHDGNGVNTSRTAQRADSISSSRRNSVRRYNRHSCIPEIEPLTIIPLPDDFGGVLQAAKETSKLWFIPDFSTSETRRRLEKLPPGSFVVRRNNTEENSYKLSIKNNDGTIQRAILDRTDNGFVIRHIRHAQPYPTLIHLIAVHCYCASILPCLLRLPGYGLSQIMHYPIGRSVNNLHDTNETAGPSDQMEMGQLSRSNSRRRSGRGIAYNPYKYEDCSPSTSPAGTSHSKPYSLLPQGAACRLLYFGQFGVGSLEGSYAIRVCVDHVFRRNRQSVKPVLINFRVHETGITVTDLEQRLFTQRNYPVCYVQHIGPDPQRRTWKYEANSTTGSMECSIFGFVTCNPNTTPGQNQCHLLSEYDPIESAQVICEFTNRYLGLNEM